MFKKEFSESEVGFLIRAVVCNYAEDESDFDSDISSNGIAGQVIGKLVSFEFKDRFKGDDIFDEARENVRDKQSVNEKLFMGAGWHSTVAANRLHKRLRYATNMLGGMQQNGGQGTEFDEESDKQGKEELVSVVKDIIFALDLSIEDIK